MLCNSNGKGSCDQGETPMVRGHVIRVRCHIMCRIRVRCHVGPMDVSGLCIDIDIDHIIISTKTVRSG